MRFMSAATLALALLSSAATGQSPVPTVAEKPPTKSTEVVEKAPPPELSKEKIISGSRVYIAPLNGYESFLVAAMMKKGTPVTVVNSRDKADYEITGVSETVQAGWAKMLFIGSQQSNEQASIVMTNLKSGVAVWGYNVNKTNSYKGKQSSSEACAKHLKARIEGRE
jgi:hypothetical protein